MIKLYGGDKQFSSWSMRAYILLEESKIDYSYKMIGLDWPVKYHENGDIEIITGENDYEIPKEPASGCGCQLTQILKNDSTALIQNSFTKFLPRVPILVDTTNEVVISDILVMEQYLRDFYNVNLLTKSTKTKYEILTFCSHIHADLLPLMSEMSFSNSFRSPNKKDIGEIGITQLNETLTLLDNILDNYRKNYLFDDCLTFADVMFAPIAKQIEGWNIEINNPKI
ncbi:glutathione S-transferase family protein, partial [Staphylococcus pseudintermedius]|nr:glutathione S-transferase family protein [Staphylococcus pseudintermedius]HCA6994943.1 glutathione S-transferase family protein [Staphylococcus pseudintermedius]